MVLAPCRTIRRSCRSRIAGRSPRTSVRCSSASAHPLTRCRRTGAPIWIAPRRPRANRASNRRRQGKVATHAETLTFTPPAAEIDARRSRALIVGLVGLALCALGFFVDRDHFFRAWLISFWLFLGISLGSLGFVMIQHLTGGQWGVFRRVFEASSRVLPFLAILGLPILLGLQSLYPWAHSDLVAKDEILHHRALYLNTGFFVTRYVIYFAVWIGLATLLNNLSLKQDPADAAVNLELQRLSGAGLVAYALTVMFAGIDWIMVVNPHWYSSLFGFLSMGGQGLEALA